MNITSRSQIDPAPTLNHRTQSNLVSTEFSERRHRLLLESKGIPTLDKTTRSARNRNREHEVCADSRLVDEAVYWFLTAPALAYVVYLALGF